MKDLLNNTDFELNENKQYPKQRIGFIRSNNVHVHVRRMHAEECMSMHTFLMYGNNANSALCTLSSPSFEDLFLMKLYQSIRFLTQVTVTL